MTFKLRRDLLDIARVLQGRLNGGNTQSVLSSWLLRIPCAFPLEESDKYLPHIPLVLWYSLHILLLLSNNHKEESASTMYALRADRFVI